MPCAALARGTRAPVANPPWLTPSAQPNPFNDAIQNSPCGQKAVTSVNGVNTTAENLCSFHWQFKHGQADYIGVIVMEP
jgi:hypothetical protein